MAITKIVLPLKSCFSAKGFSGAFANFNGDVDVEASGGNPLVLTKRMSINTGVGNTG